MSAAADQIKQILGTAISGAAVEVYEFAGDLLIEVISPTFQGLAAVVDQRKVLDVLNQKANLGQRYFIQELFTYDKRADSFNAMAHLHTIPSGYERGMFTSTLAAGDAYVQLAEIDAARLMYGSRHRQSGEPVSCRAVQAEKDPYASFRIADTASYHELEIDGYSHRVKGVQRQGDNTWLLDVIIGGGLADGYALG